MDFPVLNESFIGVKNKYAYTQVVDPNASFSADMPKYRGLAKLYFEEQLSSEKKVIRMEYHAFESSNVFCTGLAFVPKEEGGIEMEEEKDDGWIIAFVHNDDINLSQVGTTS
ncbi:Zeaxanthin 7,8(7',8')-cleavage dioxygenase, chromoplastic [Arachis hypogaea]|uniref:Zeaxanthin 7,8(7',8')-cleavage dioxygenase, chromoplastic n=1 Tax=Arachis hypogaea TaxID=3818 RepID=A0A6B9VBH2_ARAHY|nr:Zeaxanthin 7,8(7',8')-cleavage dioxygenase, chromoplastic [Arachis hypogaea]